MESKGNPPPKRPCFFGGMAFFTLRFPSNILDSSAEKLFTDPFEQGMLMNDGSSRIFFFSFFLLNVAKTMTNNQRISFCRQYLRKRKSRNEDHENKHQSACYICIYTHKMKHHKTFCIVQPLVVYLRESSRSTLMSLISPLTKKKLATFSQLCF